MEDERDKNILLISLKHDVTDRHSWSGYSLGEKENMPYLFIFKIIFETLTVRSIMCMMQD